MSSRMTVQLGLCLLVTLLGSAFGWSDVKVNQDTNSDIRNEPSITINRHFTSDNLNIVVAYNDLYHPLGISFSPDSGKVGTWSDTQLDSVWSWTGDPSVASDNAGNVYACFLSYEGTWFYGKSGIFVSKSTDGGRNWNTPVAVDSLDYPGSGPPVPFADKCFLTVDTNSASLYAGNIYVGWQRDDTNGSNSDIYFSHSADGGLTFSTPFKVNDNAPQTAFAEGAFPFVGAGGDVIMTWYDAYFKGGVPGSLYVDVSSNGGVSFGTDKKVANFLAPPKYTMACNGFKAKCFPSGAADPNDPAKLYVTYISDPDGYPDVRIDVGDDVGASHSDRPEIVREGSSVYVAWEDFRNGANSDIFFNRSTDNGKTWELSAIGPLDNTDFPGASMSQFVEIAASGNYVYAAWQDQRSGSHYDIFFNSSSDGGKTWKADFDIDGHATANSRVPHVVATGTNVYAAWSDNRSGMEDIYTIASTDNGATWGTPTRVDLGDAPGATNSYPPHLACQGNNVYCMWLDDRVTGIYQPYFNYSTNNGTTWQATSVKLTSSTGVWSQLPLRRGLECNGSFIHACWTEDRSGTGAYEVYYNRSTNGGVSWTGEVRINDAGLTCYTPAMDIQGSNVYIGWHDNRTAMSFATDNISFDYSTDNGATWQSDIFPLGLPGVYSTWIEIKSDGSHVYATWYDGRFGPGMGEIYAQRSTDAGATWQGEVHINTGTQPFALSNNMPAAAAGNGWVNVVWADPRCVYTGMGQADIFTNYSTDYGATWLSGPDEADVFCVKSTDGGNTWQSPVRVNDQTNKYPELLPFVAVKDNGLIDIAYYEYTNLPPSGGAHVRMKVSLNGGSSFDSTYQVQDMDVPMPTKWVGEYIGVAVIDTLSYTVFTDFAQTGNSDIYIDRSVNPVLSQSTVCGDADGNGIVEITDAVFMVSYVFVPGAPAPNPLCLGDVDGNGILEITDAVNLVTYVFVPGSPPPDPNCCNPPWK